MRKILVFGLTLALAATMAGKKAAIADSRPEAFLQPFETQGGFGLYSMPTLMDLLGKTSLRLGPHTMTQFLEEQKKTSSDLKKGWRMFDENMVVPDIKNRPTHLDDIWRASTPETPLFGSNAPLFRGYSDLPPSFGLDFLFPEEDDECEGSCPADDLAWNV